MARESSPLFSAHTHPTDSRHVSYSLSPLSLLSLSACFCLSDAPIPTQPLRLGVRVEAGSADWLSGPAMSPHWRGIHIGAVTLFERWETVTGWQRCRQATRKTEICTALWKFIGGKDYDSLDLIILETQMWVLFTSKCWKGGPSVLLWQTAWFIRKRLPICDICFMSF